MNRMSDTPRTDAEWAKVDPQVSEWEDVIALRDFGRQLERELAAARSSLITATTEIDELQKELAAAIAAREKAEAENDALRVICATIKCPYGHRTESGVCQLGYPGCACMDDLMVAQHRYPDDTEGAANARLKERAEKAEAELAECKRDAETWRERCLSVIQDRNRETSYLLYLKSDNASVDIHDSDCSTHNMPAYPNEKCDCWLSKVDAALEDEPDDACPDCGAKGNCKPGCPSRLP